MPTWLRCMIVAVALPACGSSSTQGLFSDGTSAGNTIGAGGFANIAGASFGGSGGPTAFGASGGVAPSGGTTGFSGNGGALTGSGGVPIGIDAGAGRFGAGGFTSSGGFTFTGGFTSTGGGAALDAGHSGGSGPVDAARDAHHECPAGDYSGTLSGPYTAALGSTTFRASLSFKVDANGAITGTLTGTSDTTSKAKLSGSMNCSTGETSISIVGGSYRNILGTTTYEGTMTATFASGAFADGAWTITEPSSTGSGQGTWSAK